MRHEEGQRDGEGGESGRPRRRRPTSAIWLTRSPNRLMSWPIQRARERRVEREADVGVLARRARRHEGRSGSRVAMTTPGAIVGSGAAPRRASPRSDERGRARLRLGRRGSGASAGGREARCRSRPSSSAARARLASSSDGVRPVPGRMAIPSSRPAAACRAGAASRPAPRSARVRAPRSRAGRPPASRRSVANRKKAEARGQEQVADRRDVLDRPEAGSG